MEFQECDIVFSYEYTSSLDEISHDGYYSALTSSNNRRQNRVVKKKGEQRSSSVPLDIPGSSSSSPSSSFRSDESTDYYFGDDFLDENELVPPHVILDRRSSDLNKNSKGRKKNLIRFRNSILKLTGFLES